MENNENCVYWELDKYQVSLLLKHVSQFKTENEEDKELAVSMAEELKKLFGWNEVHVSWKLTKKQVDFLSKYTAQLNEVYLDKDEEETLSLLTDDLSFLFLYLDALENPNRKNEDEEVAGYE